MKDCGSSERWVPVLSGDSKGYIKGKQAVKRVLFISGSLGLGHVIRDLAIARELRSMNPEVDISWLACPPASDLLREAGERLLPEADRWQDENLIAEKFCTKKEFYLDTMKWAFSIQKAYLQHVLAFRKIMRRERFDLVTGDEAHEITITLALVHRLKKAPFIPIYDFVGWDAMTRSPLERLGVYFWNCVWVVVTKRLPQPIDPSIFIGEEEDIPDRGFGFLLPHRRVLCREKNTIPVGYILHFDLEDYMEREEVRVKLGYGEEPLVVAAIGGTAVGGGLLELCGQAYPIAREAIPDLRMILVCGPRLPASSVSVPEGAEVRGYVPRLYEHFAACDLAIVQGGGTSTLELTALRRPFLFFPLEGHFEQQIQVADRLARHGAGVKLSYPRTTPEILAQHIVSNIGEEATWPPIPTDGAHRAARMMNDILVPQEI